MPCPTCDHTMTKIVQDVYWCPRCGTLGEVVPGDSVGEYKLVGEAPKLVERCREFEQRLTLVTAGDGRPWHTLGIAEAINTPENRP
jgi:hypothetical protein